MLAVMKDYQTRQCLSLQDGMPKMKEKELMASKVNFDLCTDGLFLWFEEKQCKRVHFRQTGN